MSSYPLREAVGEDWVPHRIQLLSKERENLVRAGFHIIDKARLIADNIAAIIWKPDNTWFCLYSIRSLNRGIPESDISLWSRRSLMQRSSDSWWPHGNPFGFSENGKGLMNKEMLHRELCKNQSSTKLASTEKKPRIWSTVGRSGFPTQKELVPYQCGILCKW